MWFILKQKIVFCHENVALAMKATTFLKKMYKSWEKSMKVK